MDGIAAVEARMRATGPVSVVLALAADGAVQHAGADAPTFLGEVTQFFDVVHVDDLAVLAAAVHGRGVAVPLETRLRGASGEWRCFRLEVRASDDGVTVAGHDVTDVRRLEVQLAALRGGLEHVAARQPMAAALDAATRLVESSWLGVRGAIFLCRDGNLELAAAPSMPAPWQRAVQRIVGGAPERGEVGALGTVPPALEEVSQRFGVRPGWSVPVMDGEQVVALLALFPTTRRFPDEFERAAVHDAVALAGLAIERPVNAARVERAETFDALTGLLARPSFLGAMNDMLGRGTRVGLVVLRVENLEAINLRLGFEAGDVVLAALGERLRRLVRSRDAAGRLAGGTFILAAALQRADDQVEQLAGRVAREMGGTPVAALGHRVEAAVTMGCSEIFRGEAAESAVARAMAGTADPGLIAERAGSGSGRGGPDR